MLSKRFMSRLTKVMYSFGIIFLLTGMLLSAVNVPAMAQGEQPEKAQQTEDPTEEPTDEVVVEPTTDPAADPTQDPTEEPTDDPVADPTEDPTADPTEEPTADPTEEPTPLPEGMELGTTQVTEVPGDGECAGCGGSLDVHISLDANASTCTTLVFKVEVTNTTWSDKKVKLNFSLQEGWNYIQGGSPAEIDLGTVSARGSKSTTVTLNTKSNWQNAAPGSASVKLKVTGKYGVEYCYGGNCWIAYWSDFGHDEATANNNMCFVANPDINLTKTAEQSSYSQVGETINYHFVVTNTGNVPLSNVKVVDAKIDGGQVSCGGTLAPGQVTSCDGTYTITQADLDAGSLTNNATAKGKYNGNWVTCSRSVTIDADQSAASISITKSVSPTEYSLPGTVLTYTYTVTNGPIKLVNISVMDDKLGAISCPSTELAHGASMPCTATYTVQESDLDPGDTVDNEAVVTGFTSNGNQVTDSDTASASENQQPALTLLKTVAETGYSHTGDALTYTFKLTNSGNVPLNGPFTVNDPLLGGTFTCSEQATLAIGADLSCEKAYSITQADLDAGIVQNTAVAYAVFNGVVTSNQSGTDVTGTQSPSATFDKAVDEAYYLNAGDKLHYKFTITNTGNVTLNAPFVVNDPMFGGDFNCTSQTALAPTESLTCTVEYTVSQAEVNAGSITNTATGKAHFGDTAVPAGEDSVTVNVQSQGPDLNLTKVVNPTTYNAAGVTLTYTYTLKNAGNVTLTGFTVSDDKTTVDCGSAATSLNPGETTTCTATYVTTQADVDNGSVTNHATAHGAFGGTPVSSEEATATATATPTAALGLEKAVSPATYSNVGDTLSYTFTVTNTGTVSLNTPIVTDPLITTSIDCPSAPASLAPGASFECYADYDVTQADLDNGEVLNTATVSVQFGGETISAQDSAKADAQVEGPGLSLLKEATPTTYSVEGSFIHYTYTLTNNGDVTLDGPFSVADDKVTVTCPADDHLAPGYSLTCNADYQVTEADLIALSITNHATAKAYFGGVAQYSNEETVTVEADLAEPSVTFTAENVPTCAVEAGQQCITYTVEITSLIVGQIEILPVAPAVLSDDNNPAVFTEDGEYQVTICGDWPGIADPAVGVSMELGASATWTVGEELLATYEQEAPAAVVYDTDNRYTCFPLDDLLITDPYCAKDESGAWKMAVVVQNPNDVDVEFGWSLEGPDKTQYASVGAEGDSLLTLLPLSQDFTLGLYWGDEASTEANLRLDYGACYGPTPVPPAPPAPPATVGELVIPVTAVEQPAPVVEAGVLIPVTGVEGSGIDLGFFKHLMIYLGLGFLGVAFVVQSLHNRFK